MKKIITILSATLFTLNFAFAQTADTSNYCPNLKGKLWRGATGSEVKELQKFLKDYYDLNDDIMPVSGYFGRLTETYVSKFQKDNGLTPGTPGLTIQLGVVNNTTRSVIFARACPNPDAVNSDMNKVNSNVSAYVKTYPSGDYGTQYDDFNFDGLQDRIVYAKNNNAYGDVKIYVQTTSGNYIVSDELTKLINEVRYRGYFSVDAKNKIILTGGNMGGGQHVDEKYIVVPGVGLKQISKVIIDDNGKVISNDISVSGMQKYTDKDFGFSFWYPVGWTVTQSTMNETSVYPDGTIKKVLGIYDKDVGLSTVGITPKVIIHEFYSNGLSITDATGVGACPVCSKMIYSFDATKHLWMLTYPNGTESGIDGGIAKPANISQNTMGGLHEFGGSRRFGANTIIPLSGKNFLVVTSGDFGGFDQHGLAHTIVASDASVAVPVSISAQQKIVEAERKAYLGY